MTGTQASLPALARHSLAFPSWPPDTLCPWGRARAPAAARPDRLREQGLQRRASCSTPCTSMEM